jgi:hypothetical protein
MSITLARPQRSTRPWRTRALTGPLAAAVVAAGLSVAAAPAHAEESVTAPSLSWKVSAYIANPSGQFADHTVSGGATETDRTVTFPNGVGTYNSATGATSVTYAGTFKAAGQGGSYSVAFANPTVTVDSSGQGSISADVTWTIAPGSTAGPSRVRLTTFTAQPSDWTSTHSLPTLTKTPNWAGVLPPNTPESAAAGITNTSRPVNGESFDPELITLLNPQIKAFFYSTGSNPASDALKAPASFTAQAPVATIAASATSAAPESVSVAVTGTGYSAEQPGIYVGVAESGLTDLTDASKFVGTIWSNSPGNPAFAVKPDGTFAATLSLTAADIAALDKNKSYSVYTFKAHGQNVADPTQTAERAVAIDFSGFPKVSSVPTIAAPASVFGQASTVTVSVPTAGAFAPTGDVTLTGLGTQPLKDGAATFSLPTGLAAGTTALTATYSGDGNYATATATASKTVAQAKVSVKRGATTKPTTKRTGRTTLALKSATSAPVDGRVTVTFTKGGKTKVKTVTVTNGRAKVTIPKLAKGRWTVTVRYAGTASFQKTATLKRGSFTVTK